MAAGAWKINVNAKQKLGVGSIVLSGGIFKVTLHSIGASANLLSANVSVFSSIGSEVTGSNYTAGGSSLSSHSWTNSGQNYKFDSSDWVQTGSIASIKYAAIRMSTGASEGFVLCYSTLSGTPFDVTGTNTLTIQMNASGIFTLA